MSSGGVIGGVCGKCGRNHGGVCLWDKRCFVCGGVHAAKVCPNNRTVLFLVGEVETGENQFRGTLRETEKRYSIFLCRNTITQEYNLK